MIATIRGSKDKKMRREVSDYAFTEEQAEAIVTLQLYRLTNTDITDLQEEAKTLEQQIAELLNILNNEKLFSVMKKNFAKLKAIWQSALNSN